MYTNFIYIDLNDIFVCIDALKNLKSELTIELSGGEPGLIENLIEIIELLKQQSFISEVSILSNGLVRKRFDITKLFEYKHGYYREHSQLDIVDKISLLFDPKMNYDHKLPIEHVVILTPITLKSLLTNFEYWYSIFKDKNVEFKLLTPKTFDPTNQLISDSLKFYEMLKNLSITNRTNRSISTGLKCIEQYKNKDKELQKSCSIQSKFRFIDVESMQFGRCSMDVVQSDYISLVDINKFKESINPMCYNCYKYNLGGDCMIAPEEMFEQETIKDEYKFDGDNNIDFPEEFLG